ncbi:hypothetical protein [Hymenobacter lucidus]|nr:hypothetical protein [Hymenobacter lucidus]
MNKALFAIPAAPLATRLPLLDVGVDANVFQASAGANPEDAQKLFRLELERNLMDAKDTTTYGSVKLQLTKSDLQRTGRGLHIFQLATLMTPTILGIPAEFFHGNVQAEVQIIDVKGNVLATYTGKGKSNITVAMYYGYSQKGSPRLADVQALREALNEIRPQLAADAAALREQLILAKTAGVVTVGELPGISTDAPEPAPADSTATPAVTPDTGK